MLSRLYNGPVIPAARTYNDFKAALLVADAPSIIVLCGDINSLPEMISQAGQQHKRLLLHLDLVGGIGKDKAGVQYLARLGLSGVITTKPHLGKLARDEGMLVIQRLFLVDSEAMRSGLNLVKTFKPDALEILPASVPARAVAKISAETGLPILAGGLIATAADVAEAIAKGICAVSTSRQQLWQLTVDDLHA